MTKTIINIEEVMTAISKTREWYDEVTKICDTLCGTENAVHKMFEFDTIMNILEMEMKYGK